jgi:hypothetical protein
MEVKDNPIPLKLEHLLYVQAVDHPQQVDVVLPFLTLCLELPALDQIIDGSYVIPQVLLVDLLAEARVLAGQGGLGLLVEVFDLVLDAVMNVLIKYLENFVFLPYIHLDILEVFLVLEEVPVLQLLEVLPLHQLFQLPQQLQQLFYEEEAYDVGKLDFSADVHGLLCY